MNRALLSATLLLTFCLFSLGQEDASLSEGHSRFSEHIVWKSPQDNRTYFIPVARLQEAARTSLPAHPDEIDQVEVMLRASRAKPSRREGPADCVHISDIGASGKPASYARSLVEHLHFVPFTGYGTVTDVVLGLGWGHVTTMVYVEVEEIWGCPHPAGARTVAVGDVVAVSQQKGQIEIDGERMCNATDWNLDTPDIGTKVVFGGSPVESDPYYIGQGFLLPVVDGQVLPQPYAALADREAQPLVQVRAQTEAGLQICESADEVKQTD